MFWPGNSGIRLVVIVVSILLYSYGIVIGGAPLGYDADERDALYGLKAVFKDKFLNGSWTGDHCRDDDPSGGWFGVKCKSGRVTEIVLENMGLKGEIKFDAFISFGELLKLSLRNNSLSGTVMNFAANQKLSGLDLSWNRFHGPVSQSLVNLEKLTSLQFQHNELTGEIPAFNQQSLVTLDLSNNSLSGPIPLTRVLQSFPPESFSGNPRLCGPPKLNSCDSTDTSEMQHTTLAVTESSSGSDSQKSKNKGSSRMTMFTKIFLLFDVVALIAVVLLFLLYYKKAKRLKRMMKEDKSEVVEVKVEGSMEAVSAVVERQASSVSAADDKGRLVFVNDEGGFGLNDLLKASAEGLGKGILGNTYKAKLDHGPAVVVKRLRDLKPMTSEEFTKQLGIVADLNHPNLLPPLAYFYSKQEKLLLYKFAEKGNLFNLIHGGKGSKDRIPFRWNARLSVARGVARALEYLYVSTRPTNTNFPPHGNLKSTNVLLDENNMVVVTDYGLTSLVALPIAALSMVSYRSPEYQSTKRVSRKTDVWSYGCLLLELLTGRISTNSAPSGVTGVDLCGWVHRAVREEWTAEIFDVEITVQRSAAHGMLRLLQVAIKCCEKTPEKRPEISDIVRDVENINVAADSEDESDLSVDQSLTDESMSTSVSAIAGDDR